MATSDREPDPAGASERCASGAAISARRLVRFSRMPRIGPTVRWTVATALAGVVVGLSDAAGVRFAATLLLPGLAMGLAQRIAAPAHVPPIWTLFSGLAWIAGALLDATTGFVPSGAGLWLLPIGTMALWQLFLLNDVRRAWPWLPISLLAAFALQLTAQGACTIGCEPLTARFGPVAATSWTYGAGFAAYGAITGAALPWLTRRSQDDPRAATQGAR